MLDVLLRVFGDGDTLPQLQQRFFAYRQESNQTLLSCSLELVTIYDRIATLDITYQACRETQLKGRFAEAVVDEGLQRELRRLNLEAPALTFFELRDRAVTWLGRTSTTTQATIKEVQAEETLENKIIQLLQQQSEQIKQQQKQIDSLLQANRNGNHKDRRCYSCNEPGHLARNCPKKESSQSKQLNPNHLRL